MLGAFAFLAVLLLAAVHVLSAKVVQGTVVDARTGKELAGVTVTARQVGWGRSAGYVVWDKLYEYSTTTDEHGGFKLSYEHGGSSVHLVFTKMGYHSTRPGFPLQDTYVDYRERPVVRLAPD